jgi:hypothetical protein
VHGLAGIFHMPWSFSLADNHDIISLLVKAVTPPASGDNPLKPDEVRVAACQFVTLECFVLIDGDIIAGPRQHGASQ